MTFYTCAALAAILMVGLAAAVLPFISVWDHRLATVRRRSLYDKSAGQTESLTATLQLLFALALTADMLMNGVINRMMTGPWLFVWEVLVLAAAVSALFSVLVLFSKRKAKMFFSVLSGLVAMLAACALCVLGWAFCLGALAESAGGDVEKATQAFIILVTGMYSLGFALFVALCVCIAFASAYGLALCWHVLCRNRDDFGRDYYTFTLGMRARQAFGAGLLLTVSAASMFWMYPVVDAAQCLALLPFAREYASQALTGGMFCLPLAALLWYAVGQAALPMQRRSLTFLAVPLLFAGIYMVLGRL